MDDVETLRRQGRYREAAELAEKQSRDALASELFEQACDWHSAARAALRAGDPSRGLRLAVQAGDDALAEEASGPLRADRVRGVAVAKDLCARGAYRWAAELFEATGELRSAALAWERAGDVVRAARVFERAQDVTAAGRALEAALRAAPGDAHVRLALGQLLVRFGKYEAALRTLQVIPVDAFERKLSVRWLLQAVKALGLSAAEAELEAEMRSHGDVEHVALAAALPPQGKIFGRYTVLREIASSPLSRVLECHDDVRDEHVAIKWFAGHDVRGAGRDALTRFEREARILSTLHHPNLVSMRDFIAEGPLLVLEWMPGGTLAAKLSEGSLAPARAVEIALGILSLLGEAHRAGVLHRDIKPSNVLFDAAGVSKLADFGVAHLGDLSRTVTEGLLGTMAYMSPEQRRGEPASVSCDVYAVGLLLHEMLTGEAPHLDRPFQRRPSEVHPELGADHDARVSRLHADAPQDRPADAAAARRELEAVRWPATVAPRTTRLEEQPPSERPRERTEVGRDGRTWDVWLGCAIERIALTDAVTARARAMARANHPALAEILRIDVDLGEVWVEVPRGEALAGNLGPSQRADLEGALALLHAQGVAHGSVGRGSIFVAADGSVTLAFGSSAPGADPRRDLEDLASLAGA